MIELEKLLQIFLAFDSTPQDAIQNKARLLKDNSVQNKKVIEFVKGTTGATTNDLITLYLLYLRAEHERNQSADGRSPNPFYFIYCISRYECGGDPSRLSEITASPELINNLMKKYSLVLKRYANKWLKSNQEAGYNDMIKAAVNGAMLDESKSDIEELLSYQ